MSFEIIHYYNRLNGNSISLDKLKVFRDRVEKHIDSNGTGPHMTDLKGILSRVGKAIKNIISQGADGAERVELVPIDVKKTNGKVLRVASGYSEDLPKEDTGKEVSSVKEISLSSIHTDTKRFQNRVDSFSEASANNVALHYDANKFDPIVVWKDPKNGTTYVLSGHSRFEGMKRRKSKTIPVRYFTGTEEEAIKFARVEANRSANQESLVEDLAAYKLMRDGDKDRDIQKATKTELQRIFKGKVGKLEAYSYLNTNGLFLQSLSQSNTSNYPYLERNAQWVGIIRNLFPVISHTGEDNIFHFFYSDKSGRNIKVSKDDFFALVKKKVNQLRKDESVLFPECNSDGCKQTVDREADPQKGEAFKRLREINEALESIREKLTSKDATVRVTTEEEKKYLRATAEKLEEEKQRINRDLDLIDKSQASLFGVAGLFGVDDEGETHFEYLLRMNKQQITADYASDISVETARRAYSWTSFSPERRGDSFREEYAQNLTDFRNELKPRADKMGMSDEFENDFARYRDKMKRLATDYLHAHSRVASSMITGPSKFPVEKNRKAGDRADNKLNEYFEYDKKIRAILKNKYTPAEFKPVKTGQEGALQILEKKLAKLEEMHDLMIKANKILRANAKLLEQDRPAVEQKLIDAGFKPSLAYQITLKDDYNRVGFEAWRLQNNNAEINRLKGRIEEVKKLNEKREGENKSTPFKGGSILENYDENRLQLLFDEKPDEATRAKLKKNGFKWSPRFNAWQRQLTNNARFNLKYLLPELNLSGPQYDAFNIEPKKKHRGPLNPLQMAQLQDAIAAGRTPKVNLKAKLNAKQKPAPLFDEPVQDPKQASLFGGVSAASLAGMEFKTLPFDGKWKDHFGTPSENFSAMVWGKPKQGKTHYSFQLANYVSQFGPVLYVLSDEGIGYTVKDKIITNGLDKNDKVTFIETRDVKDIESNLKSGKYKFVFIDLVGNVRNGDEQLSADEFYNLRKRHSQVSFIPVFASTKNGNFKGAQDWSHDVDMMVEVEAGTASAQGRFGGGEYEIFKTKTIKEQA